MKNRTFGFRVAEETLRAIEVEARKNWRTMSSMAHVLVVEALIARGHSISPEFIHANHSGPKHRTSGETK